MGEVRGHGRGLRTAGVLLLFLLAGAAGGAPVHAEEEREAAPPTIEEARRLLREGRVAEALDAYRSALEHATATGLPADARADLGIELARALVQAGAPDEALGHFEAALALRDRDADRLDYAQALLSVARRNLEAPGASSLSVVPYLADAIATAERVTEPTLASRRERTVAEALFWRGDDEAAVARFERAGLDALPPEEARGPLTQMALALYRLRRFEEAAAAWRRAGDLRGEASARAAMKDGAGAVALYAALLREHPEDESLLADAMAAARFANARPLLADALAALPGEGPVASRIARARGLLAEESQDLAGAEARLRESAALDPAAATPWVDLGRVLLARGGPEASEDAKDAAVEAWLEALRRDAQDERIRRLVWDQAGIDFADGTRAGGSERALARSLRAQRAVVAATPEDAEAWANLGNSLRVAGDVPGSREAYARAVALDPESASIVSDAGLAAAGGGDTKAALEAFERAARIDPRFTSARQNAARVRWVSGDDDAAEAHLDAALEAAREEGKGEMLFRFLSDRVWRTRQRPGVR